MKGRQRNGERLHQHSRQRRGEKGCAVSGRVSPCRSSAPECPAPFFFLALLLLRNLCYRGGDKAARRKDIMQMVSTNTFNPAATRCMAAQRILEVDIKPSAQCSVPKRQHGIRVKAKVD